MANKRVSELAPITAPNLDFGDLLLLSDISAHESKKLQLSELSSYILIEGSIKTKAITPNSKITNDLVGTASYAMQALSASYAPCISASYAKTSSWAYNVSTASYAMAALSASYSLSSSYCITASYALTSSVQLVYSSAFADYARTASYLLFIPGSTNGTASYALTASHCLEAAQVSTSYANTSSWAWNAITASYVDSAFFATTASYANVASFLEFNGIPNGTASYAVTAGSINNALQDFGIYNAITQSVSSSQLDLVAITPALGGLKTTIVEAYGTITVPFSSLTGATDGDIELFVIDRAYGFSQSLDVSPLYALVGGTSTISGALKYPFTLCGEAKLYGLYEVYVTASNGVYIEPSRTTRFKISSTCEELLVSTAEPMQFRSYPNNATMLYSSSLHPGVAYQGSASQVIFSGSLDVIELLVPPATVNILQYTWTLMGLTKLVVDDNPGLTYFGGLPSGCVSASAANCGLTELPLMASSSISYLNVPNNTIVSNLSLPPSMTYLNVNNNYYVAFPIALPLSLSVLLADGTGITYTPYGVPDTLITMSFANCLRLTSWLAPSFPSSLKSRPS